MCAKWALNINVALTFSNLLHFVQLRFTIDEN